MNAIKKGKGNNRNRANTVRMGPRISRSIYMLAKYVYGVKGISLEERVEALLRKDLEYLMKQKWFTDAASGDEANDLELMRAVAEKGLQITRDENTLAMDEVDSGRAKRGNRIAAEDPPTSSPLNRDGPADEQFAGDWNGI